ncbi:type II toxin-antitoxin system VapC family toxin [uncultured Sphingomonas sp.]|uniref:type II toxin-antitoxin system VapC family toxin n=1 Tax=uncultured Sphingomonas sp. TaxID=158754 RepID=UPI0035CA2E3D
MTDSALAILLDTCAAIWLVHDGPLGAPARRAIVDAGRATGVFVSPVTAWEIGFLTYPAKGAPRLQFLPDPKTWFANLMAMPAIRAAAFDGDIAIEAAMLPGDFHRDPADRLLVATARLLDLTIVTSDAKILAYAAAGHVRAIAC